jgi:glycine cleavage system H protein
MNDNFLTMRVTLNSRISLTAVTWLAYDKLLKLSFVFFFYKSYMRRFQSRFVAVAAAAVARRLYATRYFTDSHEWIEIEGTTATIGITNHAQESLGDVIFVGLPQVGDAVEAKQPFGEIESVKATSDIYSPITGKVTDVNENVKTQPKLINDSAEDQGWMIKVNASDASVEGLMDRAKYDAFLTTASH